MAQNFSKARLFEKIGARMMEPVYAMFRRPLAHAMTQSGHPPAGVNGRQLDEDHRFLSRSLQRLGLDYALYVGVGEAGGPRYRLVEEKIDRHHNTGNFAFEELTLSETDLALNWTHTSRAGVIVYIFPLSRDVYLIPLEEARAFVEANRDRFPTASVTNYRYLTFCTLVPIAELLAGVPGIRHLQASWFADAECLGRKRFSRSRLPEEFADRTVSVDNLVSVLREQMPVKRARTEPRLPAPALLRHMALRDVQRKNNAAQYVRYGLFSLVRDLVPDNRFAFSDFSCDELAQAARPCTAECG